MDMVTQVSSTNKAPKFNIGDIVRHSRDRDTAIITGFNPNVGYFGKTIYGGLRGFDPGSDEYIDKNDIEWVLAEESVVDRILTKYNNEDS